MFKKIEKRGCHGGWGHLHDLRQPGHQGGLQFSKGIPLQTAYEEPELPGSQLRSQQRLFMVVVNLLVEQLPDSAWLPLLVQSPTPNWPAIAYNPDQPITILNTSRIVRRRASVDCSQGICACRIPPKQSTYAGLPCRRRTELRLLVPYRLVLLQIV